MSEKPTLYNLFWRYPRGARTIPAAMGGVNTIREPALLPAVILYPAFMTPGLFVRGEPATKDRFVVLLAAHHSATIGPAEVNARLGFTVGLDPRRETAGDPLFKELKDDRIVVEKAKVAAGTFEIPALPANLASGAPRTIPAFKGILDKRLVKLLEKRGLTQYLALWIDAACFDGRPPEAMRVLEPAHELQDEIVADVLLRMNGPALSGQNGDQSVKPPYFGAGNFCFPVGVASVDLTRIDASQPVRAYHPLCVYGAGELKDASVAFVSDVHLNARQHVLQRSDARIVDDPASADPDLANPDAGDTSPHLGDLVNCYARNFVTILQRFNALSAHDVLVMGGDLIDHVLNVFAPSKLSVSGTLPRMAANEVWSAVDLDGDGYAKNYQPFVDHLTLYSIARWSYVEHGRPIFVVAGNHDAYHEAYGLFPLLGGVKKTNKGIPADHNLTIHESILLFGKSYDTIKQKFNFEKELYEWFYAVFTPWSDFAVRLPKQRLVGLAWGDSEEMISAFGKYGQGLGHLPRADEAVTQAQLDLMKKDLSTAHKTVLCTHFTFVSYDNPEPQLQGKEGEPPGPAVGSVSFANNTFGRHDMGTFEKLRHPLYQCVVNPETVQCVITGHSHRKGVYHLLGTSAGGARTESFALHEKVSAGTLALEPRSTPIVVSDCAGPVPRMNLEKELFDWGSDKPSGTLIRISEGRVASIEAVPATVKNAIPRIAVALEYLEVMNGQVFDTIESPAPKKGKPRTLKIGFKVEFPAWVALAKVRLHGKLSESAAWLPPIQLANVRPTTTPAEYQMDVPVAAQGDFEAWLKAGPGRSMSLLFMKILNVRSKQADLNYDFTSWWNFEVTCRPGGAGATIQSWFGAGGLPYVIKPRLENVDFSWRKKNLPVKYG